MSDQAERIEQLTAVACPRIRDGVVEAFQPALESLPLSLKAHSLVCVLRALRVAEFSKVLHEGSDCLRFRQAGLQKLQHDSFEDRTPDPLARSAGVELLARLTNQTA